MAKQNVKTSWLNDDDGAKFAPKTLVESIQDAEGISLNNRLASAGMSAEVEGTRLKLDAGGGSGGGLKITRILTNGQISDTSSYLTATLETPLNFNEDLSLIFTVKSGENSYISQRSVAEAICGKFLVIFPLSNSHLQLSMTETTISAINYQGDWRDVFIDIDVIKK